MTPQDPHTQISQETHHDNPIAEHGIQLSDIQAQPLHWLWPNRILRGKLTILEGDPGIGKSLFTLDLAARVSTGRPMPDGSPGVQGNVILIAPEDSIVNAIRPRIQAVGGDPSHIRLLPYIESCNPITGYKRTSIFTLPAHLPILAATIKKTHAVLVIIDPLTAVLPPGVNVASDQNIRHVLAPLVRLAMQTRCSILIVHYHHKGSFDNLLYGSGGAMGIIAGSRTGLLIVQDSSDENTRILATTRNSFSAKVSNLTYQVVANADDIPSIRWLGTNHTPIASILKKGAAHYPHLSLQRKALLKALQASCVPLSPKELAIQTGQDHTLVKQMLRRMLNAGEIFSPCYGLYTARGHSLTKTLIPEITPPVTLTTVNSPTPNLADTRAAPTTLTTPATVNSPAPNLADTPTTLTPPATVNSPTPNLADTPAAPATPTTLTPPATVNSPTPNLAGTPATPATLTTPATVNSPTPNLAGTPAAPATPTTPATPATVNSPAPNLAGTPAAPATPATLTPPATPATVNHLDSNFTLPPITLEHNTLTGATPPTPSVSPIPANKATSTPPASFETTIEKLRHLLHCSYKDHYLHWTFSTNKTGCPICDIWISNDTHLNPNMRSLYATLTQHPPQPGESNSTWIDRITQLL